jgi:thiol-disulfide isomerase/thioredoxin
MKRSIYIFLICLLTLRSQAQQTATITGTLQNDWPEITLLVWDEYLTPALATSIPFRTLTVPVTDRAFRITVPALKHITYFSLGQKQKVSGEFYPVLTDYMIEPGDSLHISIGKAEEVFRSIPEIKEPWFAGYSIEKFAFSGKGAEKLQLVQAVAEKEKTWMESRVRTAPPPSATRDEVKIATESMQEAEGRLRNNLALFETYKGRLSPAAAALVQSDIIGYNFKNRFQLLRLAIRFARNNPELAGKLKELVPQQKLPDVGIAPEKLALSTEYLEMVLTRARMQYAIHGDSAREIRDIVSSTSGLLREKALCSYILEDTRVISNLPQAIKDAKAMMQNAYCKKLLDAMLQSSIPGVPAYEFSLPDTKGKLVKLTDLRGKIVLIDFWYTGCGACGAFYQRSLSKVEKHFENNPDVVFVTISIDKKKDVWLNSVDGGTYTSANAHNVLNLYTDGQGIEHPLIKWYRIKGYPQQLLIDRKGKIVRASNLQKSPEELTAIIQSAL